MRFLLCLTLFFLFSITPVLSQRKTKLNTNGNGTLFGQIGYNRSAYTEPSISIAGNEYNYTLHKVGVSENVEMKPGSVFSSSSPQLSAKIGYFVADYWAITVSWDRYNFFFKEPQSVRLEGTFAPGSHSVYAGNVDEMIDLTGDNFNLSQRYGINYFAIGVQRNDMIIRTKRAEFAIQALYGIKLGGLFTKADYTFDGNKTKDVSSLSGIGLSAEVGVRFDIYQYIFVQLGFSGGMLHQGNIKLSESDDVKAKQVTGYLSPVLSLGVSIFANSKNNCASCPSW